MATENNRHFPKDTPQASLPYMDRYSYTERSRQLATPPMLYHEEKSLFKSSMSQLQFWLDTELEF